MERERTWTPTRMIDYLLTIAMEVKVAVATEVETVCRISLSKRTLDSIRADEEWT
jgi:hypothetical protein